MQFYKHLSIVLVILSIFTSISHAGLIGLAVGFIPFVGPVVEIGCGIATGNPMNVAMGVGGLALDVFTAGTGRVASNTARAVRVGKKGKSLVKAARTAKRVKKANKIFDRANSARAAINTARRANWGIC
eukprot:80254_1